MICAKCGAPNPSESAFCGSCGSSLAAAPVPAAAATGSLAEQEALADKPAPQPSPAAASVNDELPTFQTIQPVPEPERPAVAIDEVATVHVKPSQPLPAPAPGEFVNYSPAVASQPFLPGYAQQTPLVPSTVYPVASQPLAPAYPVQPPQQQEAFPLYSPPTPFPAPPMQQQGAFPPYPPQTPYPAQQGAFQLPVALPGQQVSGVFPQQQGAFQLPVALPGQQVSGVFPQQATPSGEFPVGTYPSPFAPPDAGAWSGYMPQPPPQPAQPSALIKRMPLWAFISSIVVVAALLIVLFFIVPPDWAAGAQAAGVTALILGTVILLAFGVRVALGLLAQTNPHRRAQLVSSLLLTLLLIGVGALGLTQQTAVHAVQARSLESQQKWQAAVDEYTLGGESKPSSENIAHVYVEWGEQLVNETQYGEAIKKFELVTGNSSGTGFTGAPTAFARAKTDVISAYQNLATQATQTQKYDQATRLYDTLLAQPYCDSACQTQASASDATAYYNLAEQKLHAVPPDYAGAVAAFSKLSSSFGSSSSNQKAHADYALALWGDGQQKLNTTCSDALTLYQQLSSQFSDTSQGQQAATALKLPVAVKGHFTSNVPSGNTQPVVWLVTSVSTTMTEAELTQFLKNSPTTNVNSNGDFTFSSIKQGNYFLLWGAFNNSTGAGEVLLTQRYPATVGPLCSYNFGDVNESFPKV